MSAHAVAARPSSRAYMWWLAMRPKTLPAAAIPVLLGAACASRRGPVPWWLVATILCAALCIQIGTNFANDVFDFESGADDESRLGPTRAVQAGWVSPLAMRRAMLVAFVLSACFGTVLIASAGWPVLVIGVISILSGIAYTGGPYPLGYHGLGDLFVFVFFGWVAVLGTEFVLLGSPSLLSLTAGTLVGALSAAILVVNNLRDEPTDRVAEKRTLVVRFGRRFGIGQYIACLLVAYGALIALSVQASDVSLLLAGVTLPFALYLARSVAREHGESLNPRLAQTASLLVLVGGLTIVALIFR